MKQVSFSISRETSDVIEKIVDRAEKMAKDNDVPFDRLCASMDLTACHANGCKLDLEALLNAKDGTFGHDVFGISRYIDRRTGKLIGFFLPRTTLKVPA